MNVKEIKRLEERHAYYKSLAADMKNTLGDCKNAWKKAENELSIANEKCRDLSQLCDEL